MAARASGMTRKGVRLVAPGGVPFVVVAVGGSVRPLIDAAERGVLSAINLVLSGLG